MPCDVVLLGGDQGSTINFSKDNIVAGKGKRNHLLFFFPAGEPWSSKAAPALGNDSAEVLNKKFGIAKTSDTTP